ncbi:hypothetical protein MNBD_GAMMA18-1259 [hydrothermal vent metagenome]|uniref:Uncharacterized protein n=1 Tax=hydrothermal vent metagenome TaxID=652676 RepID=A0A3B0ZZY8_9ZZZZ
MQNATGSLIHQYRVVGVLEGGSQRIGWKVGFNRESDQQSAGLPTLQIGYLLAERCYQQQSDHRCNGSDSLLVEGEIAIQLSQTLTANSTTEEAEMAIGCYATALELIDTSHNKGDNITTLLASNLVHEAVVLGKKKATTLELKQLSATLTVNGEAVRTLDDSRVPDTFGPLLCQIAKILEEHGEQLQTGDWIITGAATTPIPVKQGDHITFKLSELDQVSLTIA